MNTRVPQEKLSWFERVGAVAGALFVGAVMLRGACTAETPDDTTSSPVTSSGCEVVGTLPPISLDGKTSVELVAQADPLHLCDPKNVLQDIKASDLLLPIGRSGSDDLKTYRTSLPLYAYVKIFLEGTTAQPTQSQQS